MSLPSTMKALVTAEGNTTKLESSWPVPKPGQGEIVVKVEAVTLNPTDWKHVAMLAPPGKVVGCDFAGSVVSVADGADSPVKVGDKVGGFVHGAKHEDRGSFAEYLKTDAKLVVTIPQDVELERGSSIGIGGYTAAQAVFQRLQLPLPDGNASQLPSIGPDSTQLLVWSGATSVGQYAIQLGRAAGLHVITTASPKNHAMLQKMGAAEVYDYRTEGLPEKISKEHPNLSHALDCISEGGTQSLCVRSLGTKGGNVTVLLKPEKEAKALRNDVNIIHTLAYTCLGHPFSYGPAEFKEDQVKTDREFMLQFTSGTQGIFHKLLSKKLITGNRIALQQGGLDSVPQGLKLLQDGKVSGEKVAYKF